MRLSFIPLIILSVSCLALAACGGGGGGGGGGGSGGGGSGGGGNNPGGGSPRPIPQPNLASINDPTTVVALTQTSLRLLSCENTAAMEIENAAMEIRGNAEFRRQTGLRTIKNEYALACGATGQGVTIAIFDTGVDHTHPEIGKDKIPDLSRLAHPLMSNKPPESNLSNTIYGGRLDSTTPRNDLNSATPQKELITQYRCPQPLIAGITNCQTEKHYIRYGPRHESTRGEDNLYATIPYAFGNFLTSGSIEHGTAVAATAAARHGNGGMQGVAPEANIFALTIVLGSGSGAFNPISLEVLKARDEGLADDYTFLGRNAEVVNSSFGYHGLTNTYISTKVLESLAETISTLSEIRLTDGDGDEQVFTPIYVFSAGNAHGTTYAEGTPNAGEKVDATHPNILAGLPYHAPQLWGRMLAVAAVTAPNTPNTPTDAKITSFSNRCGSLPGNWIKDKTNENYVGRHYCLAAPGMSIVAPVSGASTATQARYYRGLRGTSFAAPHVSGALAALIHLFPTVSLKEILIRIVDSANNGGEFDKPEIYGAGLLDMKAATEPMGETKVLISDTLRGAALPFEGSLLTAGAAYGDALTLALGGRTIAAFDEYHAPFPLPLENLAATPKPPALEERRDRLAAFTPDIVKQADGSVRHITRNGMAAILPLSGEAKASAPGPHNLHLFMANSAAHALPLGLGAVDTGGPVITVDPEAFANPFLGFAGDGLVAGMGQNAGNGVLRAAAFTGKASATGSAGLPRRNPGITHGALMDYAVSPGDGLFLSLQAGALLETGRILGLTSEGAFGDPDPAPGLFGGLTLAARAAGSWRFVMQAHGGLARPDAPSLGLVKNISAVTATAFSAGITGGDIITEGDRLSFVLNQPLRIESGRMTLVWASGRTRDGQLTREGIHASLAPSGRELTLGVGYSAPLARGVDMALRAGATRHPGHSATADTELFALADFNIRF